MHKKHYIIYSLIIFTLMATTAPATAQYDEGFPKKHLDTTFSHSTYYEVGGLISITREIGHACFTGAVKKQTIRGYGDLRKSENTRIASHIMTNQEKTDWSVPADALGALIVTTIIELCARPMTAAAFNYAFDPVDRVYGSYDITAGQIISPYDPLVISGLIEIMERTRQIWSTSLSVNQGHIGNYHVDFTAAYGPGPYEAEGIELESGEVIFYSPDYMWWYDELSKDGISSGKRYVGNYFNIEQYAHTSGGQMRRDISISSPFLESYYIEKLIVSGGAEVKETFSMMNLERGPKGITLAWYELF